jgi:hypothetical protein
VSRFSGRAVLAVRRDFTLVALLLSIVVLAACTSPLPSRDASSPATAHSSSASAPGSVRILAGTVLVVGEPGALSAGAVLAAHAIAHPSVSLGRVPLSSVGPGVDVDVIGGSGLAKPLTVTFPAIAPSKAVVPAVAHQETDGSWELRSVSWDGRQAVLTTDDFSPNVLVWLNPTKIADAAKTWVLKELTGRTPSPSCPGGAHTWSHVDDNEDLVHACFTNNDTGAGAERVELRLSPNRGATVQVDIPNGVDYVWVDGQSDAFRVGLAKLTKTDSDRTVFLAPDERMTIGWRKPPPDQSSTVRVTASPRAMGISLFEGLLGFDGLSIQSERTSTLIIVAACEEKLDYDLLQKSSGVIDALRCIGQGAIGNLSDPLTALKAARNFLGPKVDALTLQEQADKLTKVGGALIKVGHIVKLIAVLGVVRSAMLATFGSASDQLQTALLHGGGTDILVTTSQKSSTGAPSVARIYIGRCYYSGLKLATRPKEGYFGCDGTGYYEGMRWSTWDSGGAVGRGTGDFNDCTPDCASGRHYKVPIVMHLAGPVHDASLAAEAGSDVLWWHAMTIAFPSGQPSYFGPGDAPDRYEGLPAVSFDDLQH